MDAGVDDGLVPRRQHHSTRILLESVADHERRLSTGKRGRVRGRECEEERGGGGRTWRRSSARLRMRMCMNAAQHAPTRHTNARPDQTRRCRHAPLFTLPGLRAEEGGQEACAEALGHSWETSQVGGYLSGNRAIHKGAGPLLALMW